MKLDTAAVPAPARAQAVGASGQPAASASSVAASASVGPALRALRQAKGLSLEEVSRRLKFSARQISALEEERWKDLPSGVSLRGLVRNYSRLLGADPDALTAALEPYLGGTAAGLARSINHVHTATPAEERQGSGSGLWLGLIVLLLLAGLGYAFWQGWLPTQWLSSFGLGTTPAAGGN
ncbi:FIG021952: putative membrane protein [plant metagenome]|uniref:FIG021952: putative membrane protein n=2 Tax=root TaxID=1 RepID=A0A1C3K8X2_9BURK|nr:helix-turn-helix transcriptional regulator [Orrella dioscoreae]SBT27837.1 FIG021952: putative membrane protein [Orrella dioscoreae]SOE49252.1 FIG021952: putative membrane protein [Orrella dioscoreae]